MVEHFQFYNNGNNYDESLPISDDCPMEFFQSPPLQYDCDSDDIINGHELQNQNVILQGARFLSRYVLPHIHTIAANALQLKENEFEKLFTKIPQLYSLRLNHYLELNGM